MLSNLSFVLVFAGIASSYFAWGEIQGTIVLAIYGLVGLLGQFSREEDDDSSRTPIFTWTSLACLATVAILGSIAIYFVTPGKIFGVRIGILSCIVAAMVHIAAVISSRDS